MDFSLSPEQGSLRDAARGWIAARWSPERMRQALDRPPAEIPEGLWREVAAMGWVGIAVAEDCGGSGAGTVTAAVLAEEAGRGLLPGPLLSALAAAAVVERGGAAAPRKALLPALCAGGCRVTVAVEEPGATWGRDPVGVRARRDADGDGWILDGTKILVPDAEAADTVLVSVATAEGAGVFAVPAHAPGVAVTPMRRLDAQSIAEVEGMISKRTLLPGRTIPVASLRPPYAINRGANVRLTFSLGNMTISASGTPLADASVGDVIKVRNLDSGVIVTGTVLADGTVQVMAK